MKGISDRNKVLVFSLQARPKNKRAHVKYKYWDAGKNRSRQLLPERRPTGDRVQAPSALRRE